MRDEWQERGSAKDNACTAIGQCAFWSVVYRLTFIQEDKMAKFSVRGRWPSATFAVFAVALLAAFLVSPSASAQGTQFELTVLSSRAYAVTGGDALVQLRFPAQVSPNDAYV